MENHSFLFSSNGHSPRLQVVKISVGALSERHKSEPRYSALVPSSKYIMHRITAQRRRNIGYALLSPSLKPSAGTQYSYALVHDPFTHAKVVVHPFLELFTLRYLVGVDAGAKVP